jgi:CDP-diacylglycerol--glycerol-3-phosphate 3-phosphatidyltransferase
MNLPNKLTIARCIMTVFFVGLMSFENFYCYFAAYLVFTVAAITDYYDGKIARERGLVTNFGKLLDPVADKVLLTSAFIMLMKVPELKVPGWAVVVILAREFLVTGARALAAADGEVIAANMPRASARRSSSSSMCSPFFSLRCCSSFSRPSRRLRPGYRGRWELT